MTEAQWRGDPWSYVPEELRIRYDEECVSIPHAVRLAARRHPRLEALVDGDLRLTFAQLEQAMLASVRAMMAIGVLPGDRVAVWAPNSARWVLAALGVLGAGGVLVPINTRFKGEEAAYVLERSGARNLVVVTDFLGQDYLGMLAEGRAGLGRAAPRPCGGRLGEGGGGPPRLGRVPRGRGHRPDAGSRGGHRRGDLADPVRHHVHLGDDRSPQGRDAHPRPVAARARVAGQGHGLPRGRPVSDRPALLPHVRVQGRLDGLHRPRRDHPSGGRLRHPPRPRDHRAGEGVDPARSADAVPGGPRLSRSAAGTTCPPCA